MKISVKQGQCRLNGYFLVKDCDDVKVLLFDTTDKYPISEAVSDDTLYIGICENSPSYRDRWHIRATEIDFEFEKDEEWKIISGETGRYTFYVTLFKCNQKSYANFHSFEEESSESSSPSSSEE
jgi:hypothetical protein